MRYSSRVFDLSRSQKIVGLFLYACSVSGYAQGSIASLSPDHAVYPSSDVLSAAAPGGAWPGMQTAANVQVPAADTGMNGANNAITAALADGLTTGVALSAGAIEMNPLIATSPFGLLAMTGLKIGLAKYAETMPEPEKRLTLKSSSALWGGAAINNLMVLFAAPPPLPIIAGLLMGFATWTHMANQYQEQDQLAAARNAAQLAEAEKTLTAEAQTTTVTAGEMPAVTSVTQGFGSSGE